MKSSNKYVQDLDEILDSIVQVKSLKKGYLTNFYPDFHQISLWINEKQLWKAEYQNSIFFIRKKDTFSYLFYLSSDYESLSVDLDQLLTHLEDALVVEIVTQNESDEVLTLFKSKLFFPYAVLVRLSMNTPDLVSNDFADHVRTARICDLQFIAEKLNKTFDKYSERLPLLKELEDSIQNGFAIVYQEQEVIKGFILYEVNGVTQHLMYWYVDPDSRNQKVGSKLFNAFLICGKNTKRQILWCRMDNENAMKRYEHYGYRREKMFDHIIRRK